MYGTVSFLLRSSRISSFAQNIHLSCPGSTFRPCFKPFNRYFELVKVGLQASKISIVQFPDFDSVPELLDPAPGIIVDHGIESRFFVSGSADNTLRLWNVATGECLYTWEFTTAVKRVAFKDDTKVVCITEQRMGHQCAIRVFDINREGEGTNQSEEPLYFFNPTGRKAMGRTLQCETVEEIKNNEHDDFSSRGFPPQIPPGRRDWIGKHETASAAAFNGPSLSSNYYGFVTGGSTDASLFADWLVHLPQETIAGTVENTALRYVRHSPTSLAPKPRQANVTRLVRGLCPKVMAVLQVYQRWAHTMCRLTGSICVSPKSDHLTVWSVFAEVANLKILEANY
ncbi:hypothetical protein B0H11DRAFT_2363792 [Mycena galericulata]|nr:hypothetical protein B0H11DRAFT_2363792 [Mycena galericulata]